jgi:signal recognition particle receptor subunit beta
MTLKVVYYGPGLCGKTTNLQFMHSILNPESRGKLLSLATETDRTLFFDFLPVSLGKIKGFSVKIQLYTVPGQVYYNATRKLVLKGADAVVFVANSQKSMRVENIESLKNMWQNLMANNISPNEIPLVIQYNKRDLPDIDPVEELNSYLNKNNYPTTEAVAVTGVGVEETFQLITRLLLKHIGKKHKLESGAMAAMEGNILAGSKEGAEPKPEAKKAESKKEVKPQPQFTQESTLTMETVEPEPMQIMPSKTTEDTSKKISLPEPFSAPMPNSGPSPGAGQPTLSIKDTEKIATKLIDFSNKLHAMDEVLDDIMSQIEKSLKQYDELKKTIHEMTSFLTRI